MLGYFVAVNFRQPVAEMIEAPHPWNLFAAMLGLFMVTSLAVWIGFRFVKGSIEDSGLKGFDAQLGGLFGLGKGILLSMVLTMFAVVMLGNSRRHAVLESFSGYNICRLLNQAHAIVPTEWQKAMEPYLEVIDEHQQHLAGSVPPNEPYQPPVGGIPPGQSPQFGTQNQYSHQQPLDFPPESTQQPQVGFGQQIQGHINDKVDQFQQHVENRINQEVQQRVDDFWKPVQEATGQWDQIQSSGQQNSAQAQRERLFPPR